MDDLPKAFGLDEGALQRRDTPTIPQRALREALVNALMHRSYRVHAPVQVIRYANRLEIRNPGFSLKSLEHLGEPGTLPRNPNIAQVLHETRFAETKGSGIRAMREAMESAGLAPPLFESDREQDQFVTHFLFQHFLGESDLHWLSRFKELNLSNEEARALIVARETGAIDNATYRDVNKVDTATASAALRRLRDAGLIRQQGRGAATWYQPTAQMLGEQTQQDGDMDALSSKFDALSSKLETETRNALLDQLPGQLAARVGALGQRHPPEHVRELVIALCQQRAWKIEELAILLSRNPETIRQNYLRPLLAAQRIQMTLPDTPNSPLQAYRSVEETQ